MMIVHVVVNGAKRMFFKSVDNKKKQTVVDVMEVEFVFRDLAKSGLYGQITSENFERVSRKMHYLDERYQEYISYFDLEEMLEKEYNIIIDDTILRLLHSMTWYERR